MLLPRRPGGEGKACALRVLSAWRIGTLCALRRLRPGPCWVILGIVLVRCLAYRGQLLRAGGVARGFLLLQASALSGSPGAYSGTQSGCRLSLTCLRGAGLLCARDGARGIGWCWHPCPKIGQFNSFAETVKECISQESSPVWTVTQGWFWGVPGGVGCLHYTDFRYP